jgi:hypothetical protein
MPISDEEVVAEVEFYCPLRGFVVLSDCDECGSEDLDGCANKEED